MNREEVDELLRLSLGTDQEKIELARKLESVFLSSFGNLLLRSVLAPWCSDSNVSACVIAPTTELCVNPTVRERELRLKRFNVLDRAMQLAHLEMEDREAFELTDMLGRCQEISCTPNEFLDLLSEKMASYQTILRSRDLKLDLFTDNSFFARWVPTGTVYLFGKPETVGYLNLIQDIEFLAAYELHPDPDQAKAGWVISQVVQIAMLPKPNVLRIIIEGF